MRSHNTTNSSPPRRATVSVSRTGPSDPAGRLYENLVTDRVAQRVVHRFEPIEVDVQHGGHAIVSANAGESSFEPIAEHQPVW